MILVPLWQGLIVYQTGAFASCWHGTGRLIAFPLEQGESCITATSSSRPAIYWPIETYSRFSSRCRL